MLKVACFNAFSSFFFVCIQYVIVRFAPSPQEEGSFLTYKNIER